MPISDLTADAAFFVAAALVLALVTIWLRRDLRKGTAQMAIIMLVGLGALALLERFGPGPSDATLGAILRELSLVVLALGVARIAVTFAFRAALGKVAVRLAANDAKLQTRSVDARAKQTVGRTADLVRRMRRFFAIQ